MPIDTPLKSEHEKLGATFGAYFGCTLPRDYGDVAREYKFVRESTGLLDKNYRAVISFTGKDRARYLNAMLTNNIRDLVPGHGNISLLLSPQGRIMAEVETLALDDRLLVVSHAMIRPRLVDTFDKFIIMDDVTLEDLTDRTATLALEGPKTPAIIRELCGLDLNSLSELDHTEAIVKIAKEDGANISCRVVKYSRGEIPGADFIVDREHLHALWNLFLEAARRHAGGPVGYAALNILRLEAGIPWYGVDFDENQIPHQAALEKTHINFSKGCYTGQEIVERVRSRGHIQRQRAMLRFAGDAVPNPGEPLFATVADPGAKPDAQTRAEVRVEVGFVTSAAKSPATSAVIGMGYVRHEHSAPGSKLTWKNGEAEVFELPAAQKKADSCG
ncbi:MAG TPA: glycine cleavage T C-terminal barrel domain-containing protein [Candidatus Dormibacteraeota bacterium]|nr:glycine cleavage T C-terminal barrel domain-containing protein [Candidatus Dormibacteraeota bacterium]